MGRKQMDIEMDRFLLYMPKELKVRAHEAAREGAGVSLNRWIMSMIVDGVQSHEMSVREAGLAKGVKDESLGKGWD